MNSNYFKTPEENFTNALKLCEKEHSHDEIISMLENGNIPQRQIGALKLEKITSNKDAHALLSNLTGQDGKIREVVSLRLKEFMANDEFLPFFDVCNNAQIFLDAITDINGNICRNIICAIENLKINRNFCDIFCEKLVRLCFDLLDKVEKFDFQDGKYKVNKEAFKLYWCLETVYVFWDKIEPQQLKEIIIRSKNIDEYTIREKAAKILTRNFQDDELLKAREELKNDKNYYVRRF